MLAKTSAASGKPGTGIDIVLLVCALFLQRFSLSFGNSVMSLDIPRNPQTSTALNFKIETRQLPQYEFRRVASAQTHDSLPVVETPRLGRSFARDAAPFECA